MSKYIVTTHLPVIIVKAAHLSSALSTMCHLCLHALFYEALFKVRHASVVTHNYFSISPCIVIRELHLPLLFLL